MKGCKYCGCITGGCNDIEAETCENNVEVGAIEIVDGDSIKAAKAYIKLPPNKEIDYEEKYFKARAKEFYAFLAGIKYAKTNMI